MDYRTDAILSDIFLCVLRRKCLMSSSLLRWEGSFNERDMFDNYFPIALVW